MCKSDPQKEYEAATRAILHSLPYGYNFLHRRTLFTIFNDSSIMGKERAKTTKKNEPKIISGPNPTF